MSLVTVQGIRDRVVPMFRVVAEEYRIRVPTGYPNILDAPDRGVVGLELDPGHSLYLVNEGDHLFADVTFRSSRFDARSSASREKFGGQSTVDRRLLPPDPSDQMLRNLIAELMSRYNSQQTILYITDT